MTISSSGVISEPPPIPVSPTRMPTPNPKTMISGSMAASQNSTDPIDFLSFA